MYSSSNWKLVSFDLHGPISLSAQTLGKTVLCCFQETEALCYISYTGRVFSANLSLKDPSILEHSIIALELTNGTSVGGLEPQGPPHFRVPLWKCYESPMVPKSHQISSDKWVRLPWFQPRTHTESQGLAYFRNDHCCLRTWQNSIQDPSVVVPTFPMNPLWG